MVTGADDTDTTGVLESTTTRMPSKELEKGRNRVEDPLPPRGDDLHRRSTQPTKLTSWNKKKKKIKAGSRARHRLRSIFRDVQAMEDLCRHNHKDSDSQHALSNNTPRDNFLVQHALQHWKVVANERCGSWYAAPSCSSCYFKSTDGHVNTWNFSLKRLNLPLLERVIQADGGCLVVDSSVRKLLPDSFSKTIPIWATVLNNIVLRYASDIAEDGGLSQKPHQQNNWDKNLYTPRGVVSKKEHLDIANIIDDRVETLLRSGAIVDPSGLVKTLTKPLRVVWMNHEGKIFPSNANDNDNKNDNENIMSNADDGNDNPTETLEELLENYFVVICWNPSSYKLAENPHDDEMILVQKLQTEWINDGDSNDGDNGEAGESSFGYFYTPGTADDEESWARHLTPSLFWKNQEALLNSKFDDDQVDTLIDLLVHQKRDAEQKDEDDSFQTENANTVVYSYADKIGETNLWIGSRRAGRPPECWLGFDAILNVTSMEYDDLAIDIDNNDNGKNNKNYSKKDRFYLQLHVEEGKRDRTQLEMWMPVGLAFLIHHLQNKRSVLVHCAQGKDRSVALALVFVVIACPLRFPLKPKPAFTEESWDLSTLDGDIGDVCEEETGTQQYLLSGLPKAIVKRLLGANGKESFLLWVHQKLQGDENNHSEAPQCSLADKEGIRIALHLIRQDREVADPTRSTMQKINRFLMSSPIYR
jgi:tRNA A64-2'-O-ribosylphosphate transferase